MAVALENLHAIYTSQITFIGALQTTLADIVATLVLATTALDVVLANLTEISQQVTADVTGVLACITQYGVESLEVVLVET